MAMISVQTELGRSANSSDISNDELFSIVCAMVGPSTCWNISVGTPLLPKCLFNLRHREERMLQFGFHHNILYGHLMRLLGPLHTTFENVGNHQAMRRGWNPRPTSKRNNRFKRFSTRSVCGCCVCELGAVEPSTSWSQTGESIF